jgi:hypothetical protein
VSVRRSHEEIEWRRHGRFEGKNMSFAPPQQSPSAPATVETLVVRDRVAGLVSIHLGPGGRVVAVGYLARIPAR